MKIMNYFSTKFKTFLIFLSFVGAFAQNTNGSLSFTFTSPKQASGCYAANCRYVLAAWIETGSGAFVKTKLLYVSSSTDDHLQTWGVAAGCTKPNAVTAAGNGCNITDATTGATSVNFGTQTFTWDGKNVSGAVNGTTVADGSYRVGIQETWGHGTATATRYFTFNKGSLTNSQTPTSDANFTGVSMVWTPSALATNEVNKKPEAKIFPNPSKGLFTVELSKPANYFIVFSESGEIVYKEQIKDGSLKRDLNLGFLPSGVYHLTVSNAFGYTNQKLLIQK